MGLYLVSQWTRVCPHYLNVCPHANTCVWLTRGGSRHSTDCPDTCHMSQVLHDCWTFIHWLHDVFSLVAHSVNISCKPHSHYTPCTVSLGVYTMHCVHIPFSWCIQHALCAYPFLLVYMAYPFYKVYTPCTVYLSLSLGVYNMHNVHIPLSVLYTMHPVQVSFSKCIHALYACPFPLAYTIHCVQVPLLKCAHRAPYACHFL